MAPSYKNTRITTNCQTTIKKEKKNVGCTKKNTLYTKIKKKPQDCRRDTCVKSNLISTRWMIHKLKNSYTTEVLHRSESPEPHVRLPSLGVWQQYEKAPENLAWKYLIAKIPQDWGKKTIYSWRVHTRSSVRRDPGKKAITDRKRRQLRRRGLCVEGRGARWEEGLGGWGHYTYSWFMLFYSRK